MSARAQWLGWAGLAVFAGLGVYGATLGWGTDRDSLRVIGAARAILAGGYVRSRSFGFPLHEAACAVLFRLGGLVGVNLGTVAVSAAGILAARALVLPDRRVLVTCVLCFCPLLLADASSAIDFGWDFAAGMALCVVAQGYVRGRGSGVAYFVAALCLLLLRPDNVLFLAAVSAALLAGRVARWRVVVAACVLAGIAAACVYLGLNGAAMLGHGVSTTRPFGGRALRAGLFLSAALGPGGVLALVLIWRSRRVGADFLLRALWMCWALYLPRFLVLPDQLDYLMLPVLLTLVVACARLTMGAAAGVGFLVCAPSFVTLSLLRRHDVSGAVRFDPALQWGALPQDWAARRFAARMEGSGMTRQVQARVAAPALAYDEYMPGYVSPGRDLVTGRMHLYRVLALGGGAVAAATVPRARYRAIWACDAPLGPNAGWRGWEAPLAPPEGGFNCWLASAPP
jgi:hypothetical protein